MRTPLLKGRSFTADEDSPGPHAVVIVNRAFATRFFASADPIGHHLRTNTDRPWSTVVGVAKDIRNESLETAVVPPDLRSLSRRHRAARRSLHRCALLNAAELRCSRNPRGRSLNRSRPRHLRHPRHGGSEANDTPHPRLATCLLSTRREASVYGADVSFSGIGLVPGKIPAEHSEQPCRRRRWRISDPHGSGCRSLPEGMRCQ
jgi:hypothetical protein